MKSIYKFFSIYLVLNFVIIYSCGKEPIEKPTIEKILLNSDSINYVNIKPENPSEINLYIDLSTSMTKYLYNSNDVNQKVFEDFIRDIFSSKQKTNINVYGFGDSLFLIGSEKEIIGELLKKSTYNQSSSKINLAFERIKKDTSGSLNFIISDAIYESGSGDSNNELFIVGENLEEFVSKYKLFGLFANKFNYYSTVLKKYYNVPLYLFAFGERKHFNYLMNNFINFSDNILIVSPIDKIKSSLVLSDNLGLAIQDEKFSSINVLSNSQTSIIEINFEREILNKNLLKLIENENLKVYVTEKKINDNYEEEKEWRNSSLGDPKIDISSKFNQDSSKQFINLKFEKNFSENEYYSIYKMSVSEDLPNWIENKYSSSKEEEVEKTYRFKDLFSGLQNHLKNNPVPLYTYYLIIK
ncbi:MAG: hypothetical protein IPJ45_08910 [Ignavibacteria bacterium]|nr:hypothetical protein [Ignavibacteria bacterium]